MALIAGAADHRSPAGAGADLARVRLRAGVAVVAAVAGAGRTARELEKLRPPSCTVRKGVCCFKDEEKLERALARLRDRSHDPDGAAPP